MGIDPGVATIGVGVIEKVGNRLRAVWFGAITTPAKMPFPERLAVIDREMTAVLHRFQPASVAVESLFFNKNTKTAMAVAQARGVILVSAERAHVPICEYTPPEVKTGVCGYGRADKRQIQLMVARLLGLASPPKPDDVADALAVAICHSQAYRLKSLQ